MSAWKPTDEQVESLTEAIDRSISFDNIGLSVSTSPAFQSIIRAAQAEALRDAARAWGSLTEHSDMYPGAHFRNEARGLAAVLARAMADAIDRSAS